MATTTITHYFDYKSPYAYLAQAETFQLEDEFDVTVDFLPLTLDIPKFLGSAEVDDTGKVRTEERNAHQWRRVKYSYMDCRREATRRGLTIRGPRHIFDSSLSHIGMLYAKQQGDFRSYHQLVYERFWKRELAIEDPQVLRQALEEVGIDTQGFLDYLNGDGRRELERVQTEAERWACLASRAMWSTARLFWGAERLVRVRERLAA